MTQWNVSYIHTATGFGLVKVCRNVPNMDKNLGLWFLWTILFCLEIYWEYLCSLLLLPTVMFSLTRPILDICCLPVI